jgi:hypothetical protein
VTVEVRATPLANKIIEESPRRSRRAYDQFEADLAARDAPRWHNPQRPPGPPPRGRVPRNLVTALVWAAGRRGVGECCQWRKGRRKARRGGMLCEQRDRARRRRHGRRRSRRIILRSHVTATGSLADRCGRSRPIWAGSGGAEPLRDGRGGAAVALW